VWRCQQSQVCGWMCRSPKDSKRGAVHQHLGANDILSCRGCGRAAALNHRMGSVPKGIFHEGVGAGMLKSK
jgi:hypothetical protein